MSIMTMQQTNIFVNANEGFSPAHFYPASKAEVNDAWTDMGAESATRTTKQQYAATENPIKRKTNCRVEEGPDEQASPDFKQRLPSMRL